MITTLQAKTDMLTILRLISSKHRPVARFNPKVCNTSVQCTSIAILAVHTNKIITIRTILYSTFYPFFYVQFGKLSLLYAPHLSLLVQQVRTQSTSENQSNNFYSYFPILYLLHLLQFLTIRFILYIQPLFHFHLRIGNRIEISSILYLPDIQ